MSQKRIPTKTPWIKTVISHKWNKTHTLWLFTFLRASLVTSLLLIVGITYWFQHPIKNEQIIVLIPKGSSLSQVTSILQKEKVLNSSFLFKTILLSTGWGRHLKAGEYLIPPAVTPAQLTHILKLGDVILHPVTLIEGETSHHFIQKVSEDPRFQGNCEVPPEGSLLPETYHFPRGTDCQKMIEHMQKAMKVAFADVWMSRSPSCFLKKPEELFVLASIVEKETSRPQERPLVAAVFLNRLKKGMPLQADPTVIYALTQGKGDLGRTLSRLDLKFESPYNTYLQPSLPPSPIANPSLASLKAVAHPASADYLYFVADGSGGHVFATSPEEHQKNHAEWRKVRDKKEISH